VNDHVLESHGIYYRTNTFEPGRRTLLFVHGISGSSSAWKAYEARFSPRYNVVTYDLRGHGKSRKYAYLRDYAVDRFMDDLKTLLDCLLIERCTLIGHSFATLLALEFLRLHPDRVDGAVLASADYDVGRTARARLLEGLLKPIGIMDRLPFHPGPGAHVDYARFPQSGDWNIPRMMADIGNTTWRVYLYCTRQIYAVHGESILGSIRVPVLVVHGRRDSIFPLEHARAMAAQIPQARLVVLDEADHIIVLNHPDAFGGAIDEFLEARPAGANKTSELLRAQPAAQVDEHPEYEYGESVLHDAKSG
jgi:pimeloyl-ACP methyl ester carboxylesterase